MNIANSARYALAKRAAQDKRGGYWADTFSNILWPGANNIGALLGMFAGEPSMKWLQGHNDDSFLSKLLAWVPGVGAYNIQRRAAFTKSDTMQNALKDSAAMDRLRGVLDGTGGATKQAAFNAQDAGKMLDTVAKRQQEILNNASGPIDRYVRGAMLRHPGSAFEGAKAGASISAVARDVAPGAIFGGAGAALLALALGSENWGKWGAAGAVAGAVANGVYNANA